MNNPCRACGLRPLAPVIDLGAQPLANNLLSARNLSQSEPSYPLAVGVCQACWLMQLEATIPPVEMFSEYVYFSSYSDQMLRHAAGASARWIKERELGPSSFVVEIASNDGYLLKNFVTAGVPCLGVEPAANIAEVARACGVETLGEFFGAETARQVLAQRGPADLILGNNVFAHAPDINDFIAGLSILLKPKGRAVLEFPYGVEMVDKVEFDTIYHEHVFYFTLTPLVPLFIRHGLQILGVERLAIHGGSLRLLICRLDAEPVQPSVDELLRAEDAAGVRRLEYYANFSRQAATVRENLLQFVTAQRAQGKSVAVYGASAKGSTLLNYVGRDILPLAFMADRSLQKHGKLSPGLHVPIVPAEELAQRRPDYAILLVWNFSEEILAQQQAYLEQGGKFIIPIPQLKVIP